MESSTVAKKEKEKKKHSNLLTFHDILHLAGFFVGMRAIPILQCGLNSKEHCLQSTVLIAALSDTLMALCM